MYMHNTPSEPDIYDRAPRLDTTYVKDGVVDQRSNVNSTKSSSGGGGGCGFSNNGSRRARVSTRRGRGGVGQEEEEERRGGERGEVRETACVGGAGEKRDERRSKEDGSKERGNERYGSLWSSESAAPRQERKEKQAETKLVVSRQLVASFNRGTRPSSSRDLSSFERECDRGRGEREREREGDRCRSPRDANIAAVIIHRASRIEFDLLAPLKLRCSSLLGEPLTVSAVVASRVPSPVFGIEPSPRSSSEIESNVDPFRLLGKSSSTALDALGEFDRAEPPIFVIGMLDRAR